MSALRDGAPTIADASRGTELGALCRDDGVFCRIRQWDAYDGALDTQILLFAAWPAPALLAAPRCPARAS
jgi:hypothetical protein